MPSDQVAPSRSDYIVKILFVSNLFMSFQYIIVFLILNVFVLQLGIVIFDFKQNGHRTKEGMVDSSCILKLSSNLPL